MSNTASLVETIRHAYGIIGRATPIKADCGNLCGAACCKDIASDGGGDYEGAATVPDFNEDIPNALSDTATDADIGADLPNAAPDDGIAESDFDTYADLPNAAPGVPDAAGMVLFPGEAGLLSQEHGYRLFRIMNMGVSAWFLVCEGVCDRRKRPLACRIFPLAPHISETGAVTALPDPRAKRMCPLADGEFLDPLFRKAVTKAFRFLARTPVIYEYMRMLSVDLDDMRRFYKNK
jgi:hypothetical protein